MDPSFTALLSLLENYSAQLWLLGLSSVVMLIGSAIAVPIVVARLPADFYCEKDGHTRRFLEERPLLRGAVLVVKNLLGAALLVAGLAMLFLPGQGILTILVALSLLDFPGKRGLELRILKNPTVLRSVNWLRRRAGKDPLQF